MSMTNEKAKNIIDIYCKKRGSSGSVFCVRHEHNYLYAAISNDSYGNEIHLEFIIEPAPEGYTIGIVPVYKVTVSCYDDFIGDGINEVFDFDNAVEDLYDAIGDQSPVAQWLLTINREELDDHILHKDDVMEMVKAWIINEGRVDHAIYWYTRDIVIPMYQDMTMKHMAHEIIGHGISRPHIDEVIQFIVEDILDDRSKFDEYKKLIEEAYNR